MISNIDTTNQAEMLQFTGPFEVASHLANADDEASETNEVDLTNAPDPEQNFTNIVDTILKIKIKKEYSFIPATEHVDALKFFITNDLIRPIQPSSMSNRDWHNALWNEDKSVLFRNLPLVPSVITAIFEDQMTRANALVAELISQDIKDVYTMDGHGRFLLCLIHALIEADEDPDDYNITIVEIDNVCHKWHELFFPNVTITLNNVLNLLYDTAHKHLNQDATEDADVADDADDADDAEETEDEIVLPDLEKTFFYLNFCSIGDSVNKYGHDEFIDLLQYYAPFNNIMLSLSIRGMRRTSPLGYLVSYRMRNIWHGVCSRGNFLTGLIRNQVVAGPVVIPEDVVEIPEDVVEIPEDVVEIPEDVVTNPVAVNQNADTDDDEIVICRHSNKRRRIFEDDD